MLGSEGKALLGDRLDKSLHQIVRISHRIVLALLSKICPHRIVRNMSSQDWGPIGPCIRPYLALLLKNESQSGDIEVGAIKNLPNIF